MGVNCNVDEFKLVLGIDGDDGVLLHQGEGEKCAFSVGIDVMVKFKCSDIINCITPTVKEKKETKGKVLDILSAVTVNFSIEQVTAGNTIGEKVKDTPYYQFNLTSGSTGVYITGVDDDACKCDLFDQIREELEERGEDCELLSDYSFGAIWKKYRFTIPDRFKNKTIKVGVIVTKPDCCDFSLLVDNISLDKDCSMIVDKETKVLSSPGFDLEKICDNKKSWVSNDILKTREHDLTFRTTGYNIDDERLSINSKEVEVQVDPASAIECDLVNHFNTVTCATYSGNCGVGAISTTTLCKDCLSPFEGDAYDGLVDIKNRQTFSAYPRLRMALDRYLYNDECCVSGTTALTYENVHQFSKLLNPRFMEIVEEMVPSTSIWNGSLMIRNTIFDQQKFRYKSYGLIEVCGTQEISYFNNLIEGTDYIYSGTTSVGTVEIIREDIDEEQPKCKGCHDSIKKTCNNVYITKIGAEQMWEGSICVGDCEKGSVSVNSYGRLVLTEEVTDTGDGTQGGGTTTDTTPLGGTNSGGNNTYNIEERFDI